MPPKIKFTQTEIVDAAFAIAQESGFSAITARNVANRLGCSVGPLYVNFATLNDLVKAVTERVFAMSDEILARQPGPDLFEKIGRASLEFARDYPVLFRELVSQPNPYMTSYDEIETRLVEALAEDELMRQWTEDERRRLLLKLRAFQIGLSAMVANGHLPAWLDEQAVTELLLEVGGDLFRIQEMKRREQSE